MKLKVAIVQTSTKLDYQKNLSSLEVLLRQASNKGAEAVFLPEVFYSISDGRKPTPYLLERGNEHYRMLQKLLAQFPFKIVTGTVAYALGEKVVNRTLVFDQSQTLISYYDKMNLFSCNLTNHQSRQVIDEADVYSSGKKPVLMEALGWHLGLSTCFDLRFPELYRAYFKAGAEILLAPSAFTQVTGQAHWHTLVRARAIENQCYMIAANQWGRHNDKLISYGHSLVVDPWGQVLFDAKEGEKVGVVELEKDVLQKMRQRMKVPVQNYI